MNSLLIFVKNAELGKVKTRLAKTVGDENALKIYKELLLHTQKISKNTEAQKIVFYSSKFEEESTWEALAKVQFQSQDLGERMFHAFLSPELVGSNKVIIIGSDCMDLNESLIAQAYKYLNIAEVVLGAAKDGGFYLLGINKEKLKSNYENVLQDLFLNKQWSHEKVAQEIRLAADKLQLKMEELPTLSDIDTEEDLTTYLRNILE